MVELQANPRFSRERRIADSIHQTKGVKHRRPAEVYEFVFKLREALVRLRRIKAR